MFVSYVMLENKYDIVVLTLKKQRHSVSGITMLMNQCGNPDNECVERSENVRRNKFLEYSNRMVEKLSQSFFNIRQVYVRRISITTKMKLLAVISLIFVAQVYFCHFIPVASSKFNMINNILVHLNFSIFENRFAAQIFQSRMVPLNVLQ